LEKGARGIETLLHCMSPLSLAPPGRSSRGHFPAAPSAGWSSGGMAIAPAVVASIGVLVMTGRGTNIGVVPKPVSTPHTPRRTSRHAPLCYGWQRTGCGWRRAGTIPLRQQPNKPGPYFSNSSRSSSRTTTGSRWSGPLIHRAPTWMWTIAPVYEEDRMLVTVAGDGAYREAPTTPPRLRWNR
jgi:hypothetical protein